jgi:hypothetical protein
MAKSYIAGMSSIKVTGSRLSSLIKARPSMAALRVAGTTAIEFRKARTR